MWFALFGPDALPILAVLVLLFGVPVFVVVVLALVSGYIQHDAERRLAALDEATDENTGDRTETPTGDSDDEP